MTVKCNTGVEAPWRLATPVELAKLPPLQQEGEVVVLCDCHSLFAIGLSKNMTADRHARMVMEHSADDSA